MKAKIKSILLKFYNDERPVLKELTAAFLKAFLAVFIPSATGVLAEVVKAGGGNLHLGVLLSLLASAFIGAVYVGIKAAAKTLKLRLKTKIGA